MNGMIYKWMDEWMNGRTDTWLKGGIYIYKCNDIQMKGGTNLVRKEERTDERRDKRGQKGVTTVVRREGKWTEEKTGRS